jgi:ectoine hydroxylase-related dioxygenase (phytanoyl-CoA dioxygenase family)
MMESPYSVFYHEHVLDKEPGTEKATPWHQDQPYYPVDGDKLVRTAWEGSIQRSRQISIWMPVDPVSLDSAVQFVKGSHRWVRPR